jgi:endonuclease YncB( thermonuclease family)
VRLARIDSPEIPGHCRCRRACAPGDPIAAKAALAALIAGGPVRCRQVDASPAWNGFQPFDRYGRMVVRCQVKGRGLNAAMLRTGLAVLDPLNL